MTKEDFRDLFVRALNDAAENAEKNLLKTIPRLFLVELHTPTCQGILLGIDDALHQIYLGNDRFYRIIDVAIKELSPGKAVAFVRVSGHPPSRFSETWDPSSLGPFKQIIADKIESRQESAG